WNSPGAVLSAGLTWNRTVCDSSWRVNFTGCSAGDAVHPGGRSSFTALAAAPRVSFTTVTRISRAAAGPGRAVDAAEAVRTAPAGIIAMSGEMVTENAGTTSRSIRFSPL